jgi:hypothetical protein
LVKKHYFSIKDGINCGFLAHLGLIDYTGTNEDGIRRVLIL